VALCHYGVWGSGGIAPFFFTSAVDRIELREGDACVFLDLQ
jgi:hypothetical protein